MTERRTSAPLALEVRLVTRKALLPRGADFKAWVQAALRVARARPGALGIRLVGLREGQALNETWRHKTGPTNVLAFPGPVPARGTVPLPVELGDLVICLPVVHREAREQHKTPVAHLAHLVVHGTLHLLGHTHDGKADAARMEALEVRALKALGYANPYAPAPRTGARARKQVE